MDFTYSLSSDAYSLPKALLWGNCWGHLCKAQEGDLKGRIVHVLISIAELLPLVGQIASLFELLIVRGLGTPPSQPPESPLLTRIKRPPGDSPPTTLTSTRSSPPPTPTTTLVPLPQPEAMPKVATVDAPPTAIPVSQTGTPSSLSPLVKRSLNPFPPSTLTSTKSPSSPMPLSELTPLPQPEAMPKVATAPAVTIPASQPPDLSLLTQQLDECAKHLYHVKRFGSLSEREANPPFRFDTLPQTEGITLRASGSYYGYCAESIEDSGWGCAWRAIQTCLSAYRLTPFPPFDYLFYRYGSYSALNTIYQNKYKKTALPGNYATRVPHATTNGWAEPFIGEMVLHAYGIQAELATLHGLPMSASTPYAIFQEKKPYTFSSFVARLQAHFAVKDPAPVMIDNGTHALTIIGIGTLCPDSPSATRTCLWIADPHIRPGANYHLEPGEPPHGIYTITLDEEGTRLASSIDQQKGKEQIMRWKSLESLHFTSRHPWMILFPQK